MVDRLDVGNRRFLLNEGQSVGPVGSPCRSGHPLGVDRVNIVDQQSVPNAETQTSSVSPLLYAGGFCATRNVTNHPTSRDRRRRRHRGSTTRYSPGPPDSFRECRCTRAGRRISADHRLLGREDVRAIVHGLVSGSGPPPIRHATHRSPPRALHGAQVAATGVSNPCACLGAGNETQ